MKYSGYLFWKVVQINRGLVKNLSENTTEILSAFKLERKILVYVFLKTLDCWKRWNAIEKKYWNLLGAKQIRMGIWEWKAISNWQKGEIIKKLLNRNLSKVKDALIMSKNARDEFNAKNKVYYLYTLRNVNTGRKIIQICVFI